MAQKHIEFMRNEKKADVLVALTHQDFPLDRNMAMHQDVDVILGGHDHVPFIEKNINKVGRDCWIVKVGCNCTHVSLFEFSAFWNLLLVHYLTALVGWCDDYTNW